MLLEENQRNLLKNVFPRFDLNLDCIKRIIFPDRANSGIYYELDEIAENPYILSEEFVGDSPDETILFNTIDHGVFPLQKLNGDRIG